MNEDDLPTKAAELIRTCPYLNVATAQDDRPWNSPVFAVPDEHLNFYWSSWINAVHSRNLENNPHIFITLYDSTRPRGTNNFRCLYLRCTAQVVTDPQEARMAYELVYPGEPINLGDFLDSGLKRFYRATPQQAWLNCLSERDLTPATIKMRVEVPLDLIQMRMTLRDDTQSA
jgi:general stress protein 26